MGCYGDDRNHSSLGAIIPKNSVGARRLLLNIGLKDLFSVRSFQRAKFVCVQRGMARVALKKPQTFSDSLKDISSRGISLDLPKVCIGLGCENQLVHRRYLACLEKDPRLTDPF